MTIHRRVAAPVIALALALPLLLVGASSDSLAQAGRGGVREIVLPGPLRYEVVAGAPRLNRKLTGPARRFVQGVPAEPVDSFVWDGEGSVEIEGRVTMLVSPDSDTGEIHAQWRDVNGEWEFRQTRFVHPEYVSGVRVGSSVDRIDSFINEAILPNAYLHGDTTAGSPVLPTLFAYVGTWGRADVFLDGARFENPFGLPGPQWDAHVMVTEGVRHPDGTVRTSDGGIFDPTRAAEGLVEDGDLEVHLVFHDARFPTVDGNFPPIFSFFYHLVFEDVSIRVVQADEPLYLGGGSPPELARPRGRHGRAPR